MNNEPREEDSSVECYHSTAVASAATHIALLDNDAIVLKGLQQIIEYNHLGSITWTTRSGREAVQRCSSAVDTPHLLLFDMSLDGMSGIDVCRQIHKRSASVLLLGITAFPLERYISRLIQAGAQGLVAKDEERQIAEVTRWVLNKGGCGNGFETARNAHMRLKHETNDIRMLLSDREEEIMILLSKGLSISEAANRMQIGQSSAATYLNRARRKLKAETVRQAVAIWTGDYEQ